MAAANGLKATLLRRSVLAAAIAALGLSAATPALADPVDLQVVDRQTGQPLKVWRHDGRLFVAGRPGSNYRLHVTNNTCGRVLVVMSVDGVNILTGETASYDQRGYVFEPHDSGDLDGWRKSLSQIAAFTFAPLPKSYAARTGRPADVGVIGIAVFKEKVFVPPPPPPDAAEIQPVQRSEPPPTRGHPARARIAPPQATPVPPLLEPLPPTPPPPAPAPMNVPPPSTTTETVVVTADRRSEKLGTAYGAIEESVVHEVPFERATAYPQFTSQVEYDTYENLVAAGVIPRGGEYPPRPFPSKPDDGRFVPDPPGGG